MKNYLKKLLEKRMIVSLVVLILLAIFLIVAYNWRVNKKIKAVMVPVASRELSPRQEIKSSDIQMVKFTSAMLNENIIRNANDINGKFVNFNTKIPKGSMFYKDYVVEWKDMPDSAWADIDDEYTVISLPVSGYTIFSSSVYPGIFIDLYYKGYDTDEDKLVYGNFIKNIKVLAVKDEKGNHIFSKNASKSKASSIILLVKEEEHILLRKAMFLRNQGSIEPVLRNTKYSENSYAYTEVSSDYIRGLIEQNTVMLEEFDNVEEINTSTPSE